jgi:hypothetical protein
MVYQHAIATCVSLDVWLIKDNLNNHGPKRTQRRKKLDKTYVF